MTDCKRLTEKLSGIIDAKTQLDQAIDNLLDVNETAGIKEKVGFLMQIYRIRKIVKEKIINIHNRIRAESFLESLPEGRAEKVTVELGTFDSTDHLVEALEQQDIFVNDDARRLMIDPKYTLSETKRSEDFVILHIEDLIRRDHISIIDFCDRAKGLGFELCPPETGPQLSLHYSDKLKKFNFIFIAMDPIGKGDRNIFSLEKGNNGPELCASLGDSYQRYGRGNRFVFRLP